MFSEKLDLSHKVGEPICTATVVDGLTKALAWLKIDKRSNKSLLPLLFDHAKPSNLTGQRRRQHLKLIAVPITVLTTNYLTSNSFCFIVRGAHGMYLESKGVPTVAPIRAADLPKAGVFASPQKSPTRPGDDSFGFDLKLRVFGERLWQPLPQSDRGGAAGELRPLPPSLYTNSVAFPPNDGI